MRPETQPDLTLDGRSRSIDLTSILNRQLLVIDREVTKFFGMNGSTVISYTEPVNFHGNWLEDPGSELEVIDRGTALGILGFLDDTLGSTTTTVILEGEDEHNLVFGVIVCDEQHRVLYLEHEHEFGEFEQFHLHSRPLADYILKKKNNRRYLKRTP